jgi:hypothetical protein
VLAPAVIEVCLTDTYQLHSRTHLCVEWSAAARVMWLPSQPRQLFHLKSIYTREKQGTGQADCPGATSREEQHTRLRFVHGQRGIGLAVEASRILFSVRFVQVDLVGDAVLATFVGQEAEAVRIGPLVLSRLGGGLLSRRWERALLACGSRHGEYGTGASLS